MEAWACAIPISLLFWVDEVCLFGYGLANIFFDEWDFTGNEQIPSLSKSKRRKEPRKFHRN